MLIANCFHRKVYFENCSLSRADKCVYSGGGYIKRRDHANELWGEGGVVITNTKLWCMSKMPLSWSIFYSIGKDKKNKP